MTIERDPTWPEISFQDRMATARFDVHERAHIVVDGRKFIGEQARRLFET